MREAVGDRDSPPAAFGSVCQPLSYHPCTTQSLFAHYTMRLTALPYDTEEPFLPSGSIQRFHGAARHFIDSSENHSLHYFLHTTTPYSPVLSICFSLSLSLQTFSLYFSPCSRTCCLLNQLDKQTHTECSCPLVVSVVCIQSVRNARTARETRSVCANAHQPKF